MNRDDVPIDPKTGLPLLPDNRFWRVGAQYMNNGDLIAYTVTLVERKGRSAEEELYYAYISEHDNTGRYVGMATTLRDSDITHAAVGLMLSMEVETAKKNAISNGLNDSRTRMGDYPPKRIG